MPGLTLVDVSGWRAARNLSEAVWEVRAQRERVVECVGEGGFTERRILRLAVSLISDSRNA